MRYEWDNDNHHPPCPGGCGELADECACRRSSRRARTLDDDMREQHDVDGLGEHFGFRAPKDD